MSSIHRERILQTLRGERPDRIACGEFFISDEFIRAFLHSAIPTPTPYREIRAVVQELDMDLVSIPFSGGWGALEQPDEDHALDLLSRWAADGDRYVFALVDGPFSSAARARGFNMLMHYVRGAPHVARELFRQGMEETRLLAKALRDAGADGLILGEDIAYNRSTYISTQDLRDLYLPELSAAAREIRALGLAVIFHSDGNLSDLLSHLAQCGLDGIQGLEPEAGMALGPARAQVGPALTLWGNLSFEFLSAARSEAEIADEVLKLIGSGGQGSHFILGSCAGLVQGMNPDTVQAVYRTATQISPI